MSVSSPDRARIREELLIAATQAVKDAKRQRTVLMIRLEARRIHERFPGSGVSLAELGQEMFRLGIADRLTMELG